MTKTGHAIIGILISAIIALAATPAHAETDAKTFLATYDSANLANQRVFRNTLSVIENGISWANASLSAKRHILLYCPPRLMVLTGGQILDMVRREVASDIGMGNYPVGMVVVMALEKVFPCPTDAK